MTDFYKRKKRLVDRRQAEIPNAFSAWKHETIKKKPRYHVTSHLIKNPKGDNNSINLSHYPVPRIISDY